MQPRSTKIRRHRLSTPSTASLTHWLAHKVSSFVSQVYSGVCAHNVSVMLAGDSAGANIVLMLLNHLSSVQPCLPRSVSQVFFSPYIDPSGSNTHMWNTNKHYPYLSAPYSAVTANWFAGADRPLSSTPMLPMSTNPRRLFERMIDSPTIVVSGTADLLHADAQRFAEEARRYGAECVLLTYTGQVRDFVLVGWLPETSDAFRDVRQILLARQIQKGRLA